MAKLPPIEAIIFDMDGTLTVPVLDFDAMRAEIGIVGGSPILEAMAGMSPELRARTEQVLVRHETEAARTARLNPGVGDLLERLARDGIPFAVLTRNSRASVEAFCERFNVRFDAVHTREDGPTKPSPLPVLELCRQMRVEPARTLVVGDFLFDIISGREAGCPTCLIHHGSPPPFADQADLVIADMGELAGRIALAGAAGTCREEA